MDEIKNLRLLAIEQHERARRFRILRNIALGVATCAAAYYLLHVHHLI